MASIDVHGLTHAKTLMVMRMSATSRVYGGRFKAATDLYNEAIPKLRQTKGAEHEDTLRPIDDEGRLMMRYQRYEEAKSLHEKAATGLEKALGKTNPDRLTAKESLAMVEL